MFTQFKKALQNAPQLREALVVFYGQSFFYVGLQEGCQYLEMSLRMKLRTVTDLQFGAVSLFLKKIQVQLDKVKASQTV